MRAFRLISLLVCVMTLAPVGWAVAQDQVVDLDLKQLAIEYDENELAASLKYKGQKVRFTGRVSTIEWLSQDTAPVAEQKPSAIIFIIHPTVRARLTLKLFFAGDQMEALTQVLDALVNQKLATVTCTIARDGRVGMYLKLMDCLVNSLSEPQIQSLSRQITQDSIITKEDL